MFELKEETNEKPKQNVFGNWIKSIPVGDYDRVRHEVISQCKITNQIFTHWKLGNTQVPPLAQEKVILIAGRDIFKPTDNEHN